MKKREKYDWTEESDTSFKKLKQRLTTLPVLSVPDRNEGIVLHNNASNKGLDCILMQHVRW